MHGSKISRQMAKRNLDKLNLLNRQDAVNRPGSSPKALGLFRL